MELISRSYQNKTNKTQFTGHIFRFLVFNLIPDVGKTLSHLLYRFAVVRASSGTFFNIEIRVQHQKRKRTPPRIQLIFTHDTQVNIFSEDPVMMDLLSYVFVFYEIKIQVLGLFIVTSA